MLSKLTVFLRGLAMGIADVIPGVSGGTLALITGIYPELIHSINQVNDLVLSKMFSGKFKEGIIGITKINYAFLVPLGFGIGLAILLFSKLITYLLEMQPSLTYAFFFGLIVASAVFLYKQMGKLTVGKGMFSSLGFIIAFLIAGATALNVSHTLLVVFGSAIIAISAMLLPGISGSFLLLLMGQYEYILNSLHSFNLPVILTFVAGAGVGLILFSKIVDYLLRHYKQFTMSFLVGLMVGALRVPLINIAHWSMWVVLSMAVGFMLVFFVEGITKK